MRINARALTMAGALAAAAAMAQSQGKRVATPNVIGLALAAAQSSIQRAGLTCRVAGFHAKAANGMDGKVAAQDPAAGAVIAAGSAVAVTLYPSAARVSGGGMSAASATRAGNEDERRAAEKIEQNMSPQTPEERARLRQMQGLLHEMR